MRFLQQNPFISLLIPTILGVLVGHYATCVWLIMGCTLLLTIALLVWLVWKRKSTAILCSCVLVTILFGLSFIRSEIAERQFDQSIISGEGLYEIQITHYPIVREKSIQVAALVRARKDSLESPSPLTGKVLLTFIRDSSSLGIKKGDIILAKIVFPLYEDRNPSDINYKNYLRTNGYLGTAFLSSEDYIVCSHQPIYSLASLAEDCQHWVIRQFKRYDFPENEWGVLQALLLGERSSLDWETKRSFSIAGAMHVLAVSGLHVGIIYGILFALLTGFGYWNPLVKERRRRIINALILIISLWSYAFITGLSPSVMRAALMFSLFAIGSLVERKKSVYNIVAASACILLWINPFLLFNVSFQLSYVAVIALVVLQPKLNNLVPRIKNPLLRYVWDLITLSFAAQIGTLPLTLYYFSQTSNYFALTNLVVVPLAGIIIYVALLLLLCSAFSWSWIIAYGLHICLLIMTKFVDFIECLPYSTTMLPITGYMAILLYCIVVLVCISIYKHKYIVFASAGSVCISLFLLLYGLQQSDLSKRDDLIIYSSKMVLLQHIQGYNQVLLTNDSTSAIHFVKKYQNKNSLHPPTIHLLPLSLSMVRFTYDECSFLLLNDSIFKGRGTYYDWDSKEYHCYFSPTSIDYLIIGSIGRTYVDDLFHFFSPKTVILLNVVPHWQAKKINEYCLKNKISVIDTKNHYFKMSLGGSAQ